MMNNSVYILYNPLDLDRTCIYNEMKGRGTMYDEQLCIYSIQSIIFR